MNRPIRTAIFPVGGLGTRFLPATKALPKEMLPVVDRPLIEYAVDEARAAGIERFIFITGRGKTAIEDHFDHSYELVDTLRSRGKTAEIEIIEEGVLRPGQVAYTRQQDPLGLGHAVWCAREFVRDEPVAVLLADDLVLAERPCLAQMVDAYERTGGNIVAVMEVPRERTKSYGIVDPGRIESDLVEVKGLVEKPDSDAAPSTLAVIGRYILQPAVFDHLARGRRGAGDEIQLTDAMAEMIGDGPFHGFRFAGRRFDCGDKAGFLEANIAFALARPDLAADMKRILQEMSAA